MRSKLLIAGVLGLVIVGSTWAVGIHARVVMSHWITVRTVTLPPAPRWITSKIGSVYSPEVDGVDEHENLVVHWSGSRGDALVRYDPASNRWLPGAIMAPSCCWSYQAEGNGVWIVGGDYSLSWGRFTRHWTKARQVLPSRVSRTQFLANLLVADGRGRTWLAGTSRYACMEAAGLCGYSEIAALHPAQRKIPLLRIARSGTEYSMAIGPHGSIWLLIPYFRTCAKTNLACRVSMLVRYDPVRHRVSTYPIPRLVWPEPQGNRAISTALDVQSNGTVWIFGETSFEGANRVVWFRNGSFGTRVLNVPDYAVPTFDRNGDVWTCDTRGKVRVTNPVTGQFAYLPNRGGDIVQGQRGTMWYVKPGLRCAPSPED